MESKQRFEVQIRHTIAVGENKGFASQQTTQSLDAPPGDRLLTRIYEVDGPFLAPTTMDSDIAIGQADTQVHGDIWVVEKEALDNLALVPKRHNELGESLLAIDLHNVPQNGTPTDLNHWLRLEIGLLGKSGPEPASQNHDLHRAPPAADKPLVSRIARNSVVHLSNGRTIPGM